MSKETVGELQKQLREQAEALRIKDLQIAEARKNQKPAVQTEPPVVVDTLVFDMPEFERVALMRSLKPQLRAMLTFAPKDIRKTKQPEYKVAGALLSTAVEAFVKGRAKTTWSWTQCNFGSKSPDKHLPSDFVEICLTHPAHIMSRGPDARNWQESVTPEPRPALMRAKIYRHELESL